MKLRRFRLKQMLTSFIVCCSALFCCQATLLAAQETTLIAQETRTVTQETIVSPSLNTLSGDSLYALLVAELAASRKQYDVALFSYYQQTHETRNPQIAARAVWFAQELNDTETALELSLLWAEYAPTDKDALTNACLALTRASRWDEAFEMSKRIKALDGESLFYVVAEHAATVSELQRQQILTGYRSLLEQHPTDEQLLVGTGLLLQQQGDAEDALHYAQQAVALHPSSSLAALLDAKLLIQLKRDPEALTNMNNFLTFFADATSLRIQYAQTLIDYDKALAQKQFMILAEQLPKNNGILLSLAKIAVERKDHKIALKTLNKLIDNDAHVPEAHYYLGRIAENQKNTSEAIFNYLQVEPGPYFLPATTRLLNTLIRRGDLVSAQQHMKRLRKRLPDQAEQFFLLHAQVLSERGYTTKAKELLDEATKASANKIDAGL
jgi:tetratricopeptide (TPR) repeat protein